MGTQSLSHDLWLGQAYIMRRTYLIVALASEAFSDEIGSRQDRWGSHFSEINCGLASGGCLKGLRRASRVIRTHLSRDDPGEDVIVP